MKKFSVFAAIIAVAMNSALAADLEQESRLGKVILFDGYCDGIRLEFNKQTGHVIGFRFGCLEGVAAGFNGVSKALRGGESVMLRDAIYQGFWGTDTLTVINGTRNTWGLIQTDGTVLNSGTFSVLSLEEATYRQSRNPYPSSRKD